MLYGDGYIYIPVGLSVGTDPFLVVEYGGKYIHGGRSEPLAVVALLQLLSGLSTLHYMEPPRLMVYC